MNVTRAVLPVMRKQGSGHIITISSSARFAGFEFGTAYAASKFGLEGWMESLAAEVAPFGISTTIVNPGFFRTELLTKQSTNFAAPSIGDYAERKADQSEWWKCSERPAVGRPGEARSGTPDHRRCSNEPPLRFIAGADAIAHSRAEDRREAQRSTPFATSRRRLRSTGLTSAGAAPGPLSLCLSLPRARARQSASEGCRSG